MNGEQRCEETTSARKALALVLLCGNIHPIARMRLEDSDHAGPGELDHLQLCLRACIALAGDKEVIDVVTVSTWLKREGLLERAGGLEYLCNLLQDAT